MVTTAKANRQLEMAIQSMKDLDIDVTSRRPIRAMLWGAQGSGKTTTACRLIPGKVILVTAEHGAHALDSEKFPTLLDKVEAKYFVSLDLALNYMRLIHMKHESVKGFTGVVLDSATTITNALRGRTPGARSVNSAFDRETPFEGFQADEAIKKLDWDDHGIVEGIWRNFFTSVRDEVLSADLVVTAQQFTPTPLEKDAGAISGPSLPRGPLQIATADLDFNVRLFRQAGVRSVLCDDNTKFMAKNRAGFPAIMKEEDFIKGVREWCNGSGRKRKNPTPSN